MDDIEDEIELLQAEIEKANALKAGDKVSVSGKIEFVVIAESEGKKRIYIGPHDCIIGILPK